jgi:hypothetical protein
MSKKLFHDSEHWHDRAEEARKVAAQIIDPVSRRKMLEIAESYESLAGRADKIEGILIAGRKEDVPPMHNLAVERLGYP